MLSAGARIGPYQIVSALGAGGMGEVYRARDAKLSRDVAIKILPPIFAADPDRVMRFEREAQALAALNHPNIAQVFGAIESPAALAMELVEGEDLAERLRRGPLPLDDVIAVARQIADALAAAHERGIVHRDLKPANIKVREDGTVKVLDFGLARVMEPPGSSPSAGPSVTSQNSPTFTSPALTQMGVIIGTAAYMAPEQARGKAADRRADVWAFGCVLFEMLTGVRAFAGEDVTDTLAAVVRGDPQWTALPVTPAPITRLLRRCLQKDPAKRLDSMTAVRLELDEAVNPAEPAEAAPSSSAWRWFALGSTAVALAAIGAAAYVYQQPQPAVPEPRRLAITATPELPIGAETNHPDVAISADGRRVAYFSRPGVDGPGRFAIRDLSTFDTIALAAEGDMPRGMFFSPDGRWVAYQVGPPTGMRARLMKIPVGGGAAVPICDIDSNLRGGVWLSDGTIVFATARTATGLFRVNSSGGQAVQITQTRAGTDHLWPASLPGEKHVLFSVRQAADEDTTQVALLSLDTGEIRVLVQNASYARYVATGHIVYAADGTLRAVPVDVKTFEVRGESQQVLSGVVTKASGAANFAIADPGTLVYLPGAHEGGHTGLAWFERDGRLSDIPVPSARYGRVQLSPDGRRAAVVLSRDLTDVGIWIADLSTGAVTRLTPPGVRASNGVWSPDGRRIAFWSGSRTDGPNGIFVIASSGTGEPVRLTETPPETSDFPTGWSPDGTDVLFTRRSADAVDIHKVAATGGAGPEPVVKGPAIEREASISKDGRWIAYISNDSASGGNQAYIRSYPDVDRVRIAIPGSDAAGDVTWQADGRGLHLFAAGRLWNVPLTETGGQLSAGKPVPLASPPDRVVHRLHAVAPDGRVLYVVASQGQAAVPQEYRVVLNWFTELREMMTR